MMTMRKTMYFISLACVAGWLAACNLGQPAPSEPVTITPQIVVPQQVVITPTPTPLIQVPPTLTPTPQLLPAETLGPITVEGTTHRTQEAVRVHVMVGKSVTTVTCSFVLQDTGQTTPLGAPTVTAIDANINENVYTFTPAAAGTYVVACTGVATTVGGQRPVSDSTKPFAVEAKG